MKHVVIVAPTDRSLPPERYFLVEADTSQGAEDMVKGLIGFPMGELENPTDGMGVTALFHVRQTGDVLELSDLDPVKEIRKWMVVTKVVEVLVDVDEEESEVLVTNVQNLHEVAPDHGFVPDVFNTKEEAEACQAKIQSFNGY